MKGDDQLATDAAQSDAPSTATQQGYLQQVRHYCNVRPPRACSHLQRVKQLRRMLETCWCCWTAATIMQATAQVCTLAWPLAGADLLAFSKELVITSYVGHMGPDELSALVLGQAVYNVTGAAP